MSEGIPAEKKIGQRGGWACGYLEVATNQFLPDLIGTVLVGRLGCGERKKE